MPARTYRVPGEIPVADDILCLLDGQKAPVQLCRVSAVPFNRRWPGHQRQIEQSEIAYFTSLEMTEPVTVQVRPGRAFKDVVVRPLSKNVHPQVENGVITFILPSPGGYSLEMDGYHHNLHLFADPPANYAVDPHGPATIYFGPGCHDVGILELKDGQTVFIDEGAVVYGCIHATDCRGIRILGRGVLDNSKNVETILFPMEKLGDGMFDVRNAKREHTIQLIRCQDVVLDGFTIRDSLVYNVGLWGCDDVEIRNLKIIGSWRFNTDGIDFHNCRRCHVTDCFVRTFDDSICFKGHLGYQQVCEDILVENCVVWCDWDHCLEIGAECCADHMRNLTFRNMDVIRSLDIALNIGNVDYGHVHDVLFDNIRVEMDPVYQRPRIQRDDAETFPVDPHSPWLPTLMGCSITEHPEYSEGRKERGHISDITYRNIHVRSDRMPPSSFRGYDAHHRVENVTIEGLYRNGVRVKTLQEANVYIGEFADNIVLK
ncbi:MAG TPA: glycosyl hydrolase family 28 protein [Candidatus Latescibacteria bacterium]|nr:glycosyl hydrolase family 28 protein [Candidatus Latescibacterota bacterium]